MLHEGSSIKVARGFDATRRDARSFRVRRRYDNLNCTCFRVTNRSAGPSGTKAKERKDLSAGAVYLAVDDSSGELLLLLLSYNPTTTIRVTAYRRPCLYLVVTSKTPPSPPKFPRKGELDR